MEKVLVTGAAGFIGSHIVDELLAMGKNVLSIDDLSGGFIENINTNSEFVNISIQDANRLNELFKNNSITHVFHLAAYAAEGLSHYIRNYNYSNNLTGSINLINCAINYNIKRFVFTSSIAVYGKNQLPYTEKTIPQPEDPYGIAKYAVEQDLICAKHHFGLDFTIFRPHNVYGERQNIADPYRNVIGIFLNKILKNERLPVFGDGNQSRAFTYITDISKPIAHSAFMEESKNNIYNIGSDNFYTINELISLLSEIFGYPLNTENFEERNEVKHAYSSHNLAHETFSNLIEDISLRDGLIKMIDWVNSFGSKSPVKFDNIEIYKKLPKAWL